MNSILVWLVAAVLGLGATAGSATSSPTGTRQPASAFGNREMLSPCGTVDVTPGPGRTRLSRPAEAWDCLRDASGRRGAELITLDQRGRNVSVHTVYRARRDGQLEIWSQRSRTSPYRPLSGWRYHECTPSEDLGRQPCAP